MAKKKKKAEKPPREYTRRQLSQWQRQKRRQLIIRNVGIFIIAAAILMVLVGWYTGEYRPTHQTVIRVNDTKFDMRYYLDALRVGGEGASVDTIIAQSGSVIREIEQSELVRRGASELGIIVSDDEARQRLMSLNLAVTDASLDLARGQILLERLRNEHFEYEVPKSAEQVHMMAMLLESERQVYEIRDRLQNSENFTALAEEFSLDSYTKDNKGDLGWHPEEIFAVLLGSSVPGDYAFGTEVGALSQPRNDEGMSKPVGYWLVKVLEREEGADEAQVQAILLGSEEEALSVKARLAAGEDLEALAKELSQFEESRKQGGELGVVSEGEMSPALDEYIFAPEAEPGIWSEPVRDDTVWTQGAYWLVKVVDRDDDRQLESEDRDYLLTRAINEWITSLWADPANEVEDSHLDAERIKWAAERVAGS